LLFDDNGDGVSSASERMAIAQAPGLNHGIALYGGYLYATSASTVYRWPYDGSRQLLGTPQTIISGIPTGGHSTRTLAFDTAGNLYLSVGSGSNLDPDFARARVVRFPASLALAGGATWSQFQAFADGTRNEVGLRFDQQGRLWGVENGSDDLSRTDLGGDIHNDNPAEELNLFLEAGFYGYPYCWTEGSLPGVGLGPLTQWAYPSVMNDGVHTDAWCRDSANVRRPSLAMQAHSAPLDLVFYDGGLFPPDGVGDLFVTFHGSWNRSPATGYKVVRIPFGADAMPAGTPEDFLTASSPDQPDSWGHRPVGLAVGTRGELFVTSDASGLVIAVGHEAT
jgi:glucose/arabinose dehydrogenase